MSVCQLFMLKPPCPHIWPYRQQRRACREEKEQCERMHRLIEEHGLDGQLRWLVAQKNRVRNGELYRVIADSHGAFVQPALYEAFGLTVRRWMAIVFVHRGRRRLSYGWALSSLCMLYLALRGSAYCGKAALMRWAPTREVCIHPIGHRAHVRGGRVPLRRSSRL